MDVHSLGIQTDVMIARLRGSTIEDRGDHQIVRSPANPDFWWGNFMVLPNPPDAEQVPRWIERFVATFPASKHLAFAIDLASDAAAHSAPNEIGVHWTAAWVDHGLEYSPSSVMSATTVSVPPHPQPAATCRPLSTSADWDQWVELRVANNDQPGDSSYRGFVLKSGHEIRAMIANGAGQWFGAFRDGELCSTLGLFTDGGGTARFQSVDTHPAARRQGFAGTLVHHAAQWGFRELGAHTLVIVADPAAEAIRVYRSLGFVEQETEHQLERPPPD